MAKGPGGKSVGRVSIRVVPDTTRFRADLKKSMDRLEKATSFNLRVEADTGNAAHEIKRFAREWNNTKINLDVDANTAAAAVHVREFARKRTVPIDLDITKRSVAKAVAIIGSLSGGRVAGDLVKNITDSLSNLDRSLPKLAALVALIGSIGAIAISSVGGIVTLAASLSTLLGLAAPAPGLLGALLTGVVVLGVALSDTKDQLDALSPVWTRLKSTITDNFWSKARQPIIDFVRSVLPQLNGGLAGVSDSLGAWAASLAAAFQKALGGGVLENLLAKLRDSIDIATTGTGGFANAIVTLGTFGANQLPRLAQWFADITSRFDAWLTTAATNGSLDTWLNNAITAAQQLWDIFGSVLNIFSGVEQAAVAAGGGGLVTVAAILGKIADVVNTPAFQSTLTTVFQGAAAGVAGLATALGPIGDMFTALAPTISSVLSSIGVTLGTVLGQIATTLAQPEIAQAILSLFNGLRDGIQGVLPALPALGTLLATVAQFAGVLAGQLGQVLGQALIALAPLVSELLTALEPIVPILGEALVNAIITLAPSFLQLVQAIAPLLPQLVDIVANSLPQLVQVVSVVTPLIVLLAQVIGAILTPIQYWISLGGNVVQTMQGVQTATQFVSKALNGTFGPAIQWLVSIIPGLTSALRDGLAGAAGFVSSAFESALGAIRFAINGIIGLANGAIRSLNGLSVSIPSWIPGIGGQTWGVHLPTIPYLATGADVEPSQFGTAVVLGDGGQVETVTNRGRTNRLIELANALAERSLAAGSGGVGGNTFNITEVSDTIGTAMAVVRRFEALGA
jgi:hypothetical protein